MFLILAMSPHCSGTFELPVTVTFTDKTSFLVITTRTPFDSAKTEKQSSATDPEPLSWSFPWKTRCHLFLVSMFLFCLQGISLLVFEIRFRNPCEHRVFFKAEVSARRAHLILKQCFRCAFPRHASLSTNTKTETSDRSITQCPSFSGRSKNR